MTVETAEPKGFDAATSREVAAERRRGRPVGDPPGRLRPDRA
ncbi:hypothetical protein [Streptomyces acidiscabies]|nr:hypothetical protein [Streptomyces acidiscabies]